MSMASITVVGHLGKDPVAFGRGNTSGCRFTLAHTPWSKNRDAETIWFDVAIFRQELADVVMENLAKGDKVMVQGEFKMNTWEKDNGDTVSTPQVIIGFGGTIEFMSGKDGGGDRKPARRRDDDDAPRDRGGRDSGRSQKRSPPPVEDMDDEIPF